jgi:crotonobetainyl-CoA:carnitine CoA-transferase CaiB-like acyl-CoA transferase
MAASHKAIIEAMKEDGLDTSALDRWDWTRPHDGEWTAGDLNAVMAALEQFFLNHTKDELFRLSREKGVHIGICLNVADALKFPQYVERDFWKQVEHPELGATLTYPGPFVRFSDAECGFRSRAPHIGEHNEEVYTGLGISKQELTALKEARII